MILKYGAEIDKSAIDKNLNRITNQIYKLLPSREEKSDWQKPLTTIIEELVGMDRLLFDQHEVLFPLLCKLEGLFLLSEDKDFFLYRRTIFECLGLINNIKI
jgi:hypothetical protein